MVGEVVIKQKEEDYLIPKKVNDVVFVPIPEVDCWEVQIIVKEMLNYLMVDV